MNAIHIAGRPVGSGRPCFVIAEAGVNHNGDMDLAFRLIDAAQEAGADAVKFQSFITEDLIVPSVRKADYQVSATGDGGGQYAMLKALELSFAQHRQLKDYCERAGIVYLCTPYDYRSADMLAEMGVAAYKVASTDTTNVPFLRYLGDKGLPVLLSTGMSTLGEVEQAVAALRWGGRSLELALLHCTSEYPAPLVDLNLKAMDTLRRAFAVPVGYSDHSVGIAPSTWAVVLGACVLEKHFTLDRSLPGPDHRASIEPGELADLVSAVRDVECALGDGVKRIAPSEAKNKPVMQKRLVALRDIAEGEVFAAAALAPKRCGTGLLPALWDEVIGRTAARAIAAGSALSYSDVNWDGAGRS
ncbi:MAG: N-acetylneuraminate synthase [Methylococcaceae bacterium]|nr:N-acetylneuraminate synthase [Methylococcaceae bacterium]